MNKALPAITESPDRLQHQFRAARDPKQRLRLQALYLLASGQARSRLEVARLLAVHRHTVRTWLTAYEAGGLKALLTIHTAPGKRSALSPPTLAQLQQRLAQPAGFASYGDIQHYLAQEHQVELGYSTVHALVRYKLKANPKAPRRSHPKKTSPRSSSFRRRSPRNSRPR